MNFWPRHAYFNAFFIVYLELILDVFFFLFFLMMRYIGKIACLHSFQMVTVDRFVERKVEQKKMTIFLLKVIYKGCFESFVALYADRICSDQHFVENRIEKFLFV